MDMAAKRFRALHSVDHVRVIEAKNCPTYPASYFTTLQYSVLQRSRLCSASSDVVNCDPSPVLHEKVIAAFGKSPSYSSFALSCSKTPVTALSFPTAAENTAM